MPALHGYSPAAVLARLCRKSSPLARAERLTLDRDCRSVIIVPTSLIVSTHNRRLHEMHKPAQEKPAKDLPQSGYAVVVDGQIKTEFKTKEGAQNGARDLKRRFPMLQIKVYDAETKLIQEIELVRA